MSVTRYKWEKWNTITSYREATTTSHIGKVNFISATGNLVTRSDIGGTLYSATSYTLHHDDVSGWFSVEGLTSIGTITSNTREYLTDPHLYYIFASGNEVITQNKFLTLYITSQATYARWMSMSGSGYIGIDNDCTEVNVEKFLPKGSTKLGEEISKYSTRFPENGVYDGNWYILIASDNITPASVTFPTQFCSNSFINVKIAPSANLALSGTITYTVETTSDGTNWGKKAETADTEITLYVPLNTTKFGVRVKARDDNGIEDDTYVYGNGVTTATPETSDFLPYSGNIGYAISKHILDAIIASASSFSLTATINGATVYSGTGINGTNAITISDSAFSGLPENEPVEMTVKAELASGTVTRVYTFRKFDYDHTSLSGVFTGAAKALRNQTGDSAQILGANIPEEIMELPAYKLPEVTATPEKVTEGYIFIDSNGELKAGTAASSLRLRATETRNIRLYTTQSWSSSGSASYSAKVETLTVTPESKDKMCLITAYVGSKDQMLGFWAGISPAAIGIAQTVTTGRTVTGGSGGSVTPGIRCNSYSVTDESIVLEIQENAVGVSTFDTKYAITIKYYE